MDDSILPIDDDEPPSFKTRFPLVTEQNRKRRSSRKDLATSSLRYPSKHRRLGEADVVSPPQPGIFSTHAENATGERTHGVIGNSTQEFRRTYYREITEAEWNDWRWQLRNRITGLPALQRVVNLSQDEFDAIALHSGPLPVAITPYYASLLDPHNPRQPLRRTVIKAGAENNVTPGEAADPLHEDADSPVPGIVHRYPDRVLLLVTGFCAVYCRYCTRSRMVGTTGGETRIDPARMAEAIRYIREHTEIRDVVISGGDPLTLPDAKLKWLLTQLRAIPHVEILRIGTKVPAVLPQRITPALVSMLRKFHPLFMSLHFTHPDELTPEVALACTRLADAGIPLGSQTVLLKGVNDDVDTLKTLYKGLLAIRVRPYYLYQCDPVHGSSHFRTPVSRGLEMIAGLRGHVSGYAIPTYVVDAPGGGGKIPLLPEYVLGHDQGELLLRNYEGKVFRYPDDAADSENVAQSSTDLLGSTQQ